MVTVIVRQPKKLESKQTSVTTRHRGRDAASQSRFRQFVWSISASVTPHTHTVTCRGADIASGINLLVTVTVNLTLYLDGIIESIECLAVRHYYCPLFESGFSFSCPSTGTPFCYKVCVPVGEESARWLVSHSSGNRVGCGGVVRGL